MVLEYLMETSGGGGGYMGHFYSVCAAGFPLLYFVADYRPNLCAFWARPE